MNKMSCLTVVAILVGLVVFPAFAQTPPLSSSIKINDAILRRGHVAIVHVKIKWGPVPRAKPEGLRSVFVELIKPGARANRCTRGDCIGATFSLPNQLTPKVGELIEFDIVLNDLNWNDVISSLLDLSQPKNLFDVVPAGTYSLLLSTSFRANYSTKRNPRDIEVVSNSINVAMK